MATVIATGEGRVLMDGVKWETYECLLREFEYSAGSRLTYDQGRLEIMSPLFAHEEDNRNLETIVEILAEEWGMEFRQAGAITLKRADMARGVEPDSSFYIQSFLRIEGQHDIDLDTGDPPPDLAIEVDLTSPSLDKLPLYAVMEVPEVWRLRSTSLTFYVLTGEGYQEQETSLAFPRLTSEQLMELLALRQTERPLNWRNQIREWARSQQQSNETPNG